MAGDDPRYDKGTKGNVTNGGIAHVFEEFGGLSWLAGAKMLLLPCAYRKDNVDEVHDAQDNGANAHVIIAVGEEHECGRENMVREHLSIILALLLNVDNKNLLNPEAPLYEVVPLEKTVNFAKGPTFPDTVEV